MVYNISIYFRKGSVNVFDFTNSKKKTLLVIVLIAIAVLLIVALNYEKFDSFFGQVGSFISVLNSVFTGIVIAYILSPLERFFSRRVLRKMKMGKLHKFLSIFLTYFLVIGLIAVFFLITTPQLLKSISELPPRLEVFISDLKVAVNGWIVTIEASDFYNAITSSFGAEKLNLTEFFNSIISGFVNAEGLISNLGNFAFSLLGKIYSFAANLLIGFFLSIYLLASKAKLSAQGKMIVNALFGKEKAKRFLGIVKFSDRTFGSFIQGKIINSIITGIISVIVFAIFGLPYPQLLAVIVGFTDIIPVFGPFIGGIPCAFLVLIAAPDKLILFIILIVLIQQFDGNYIAPKILGESTGLSSLGVFVAILVMGGYFGLIGMIIGVPLFAVIVALTMKSVEKKLAARGLSPDIADYYYRYSDDLSIEENESFFKRVIDSIIESSKKVGGFFKNIFSKKEKNVNDTSRKKSKKSEKQNSSDK